MTAQASDTLYWNEAALSLQVLPLDLLFRFIDEKPQFAPTSTANWRGYTATWEIIDDQLFLVGVHGKIEKPTKKKISFRSYGWGPNNPQDSSYEALVKKLIDLPTGQDGTKIADSSWSATAVKEDNGFIAPSAGKSLSLDQIINSSTKPVCADWYSGLLRCSHGDMLEYVHGGFGSLCERDLFVLIEAGRVSNFWIVDNVPAFEDQKRREKEFDISFLAYYDSLLKNEARKSQKLLDFPINGDMPIGIEKKVADFFKSQLGGCNIGDDIDVSIRYKFDRAIFRIRRGIRAARLSTNLKDDGAKYKEQDPLLFLHTLKLQNNELVNLGRILDIINLPDDDFDGWVSQIENYCEKLLSEEAYEDFGFYITFFGRPSNQAK